MIPYEAAPGEKRGCSAASPPQLALRGDISASRWSGCISLGVGGIKLKESESLGGDVGQYMMNQERRGKVSLPVTPGVVGDRLRKSSKERWESMLFGKD